MLVEQATDVRKHWNETCDSVIHNKPKFIKRTRDRMWFSNTSAHVEGNTEETAAGNAGIF
ncbi:MAG: hypothetical protein LIP12_15510 [Clostridiales bacterium]|nr:hypothetical protein [Clostridiales bacterium]